MADTLQTKKVTDLTENTAMSDEDLFMVGSAGTASLRKLKWSNIWNTIKTAVLGKLVANNLTTTEEGYLLDARQGKALDEKISELNTEITDRGIQNISLSSTTLFASVGTQYAIKSGKTVYLHICFAPKSTITSGSVLSYGIPVGYRPTEDINNYGVSAHDGNLVAFNITTDGSIVFNADLPTSSRVTMDVLYPID